MTAPILDIDATPLLAPSPADDLADFVRAYGRCACPASWVAGVRVVDCRCGMVPRIQAACASLQEASRG